MASPPSPDMLSRAELLDLDLGHLADLEETPPALEETTPTPEEAALDPNELADMLSRTNIAAPEVRSKSSGRLVATPQKRKKWQGLVRSAATHGMERLVRNCFVLMLIKPPHSDDPALVSAILDFVASHGTVCFDGQYRGGTDAQRRRYRQHYAEHASKDFYESLCSDMTEWGKTRAVVVRIDGDKPTKVGRAMCTLLRHKYGSTTRANAVHCSDSVEAATNEIKIWFGPAVLEECQ